MNNGWMEIGFVLTAYGIFGHEVKATERSPIDKFTWWITTQSKGFTKNGIENISRFVWTYVYLVLTSQVQARSSIMGNLAPEVDAQQVFKSTFKALINENYSIGTYIGRYQGVLENALSKVDFSVSTGIYMLPSDLSLSLGKTKGYNNKILVSNKDMKIGWNKDINKKLPVTPPDDDTPRIVNKPIPAVWYDSPKMLIEKYNDEKLVITILIAGAGLIAYHFW